MIATIKTILTRDLNKLSHELEQYSNETNIWKTEQQISNSAGNLCLHILGNLNTYIGAALGNTGYVRDRPLEFAQKDVPRAELLQRIAHTITAVEAGLDNVKETELQHDFPVIIWDKTATYEYTLIHLTTHLAWHLGQVNYHRRLLDK